MNIKDILAKVAKGEVLTDDEKTALAGFDPDKVSNGAAAAARKEAEKQRDALKAQLAELNDQLEQAQGAGKSEVEQLKAQLAKTVKLVEDQKAIATKADNERRALVRGSKLDRILGGLKFIDGVDKNLPRYALERAIADLKDEDLDNADTITPIIEAFKGGNKGILLDDSGGGAGTPTKDSAGAGAGLTMAKISGMSNEEFLKQKDSIWANADKIK